ncbi:NAD(P)H-dependent oxidoreductase [Rhodococcus spongiicola]|uniref:Flavodoxin family protein n=1 Tax=Rhodococcus spongiicola TaxID=2487352 RepID=A0A3S3E2Q0_9NOCA|nr:NAD(P)H-dependent oxidoreductase [Rhodococcus spongiicola]RVW04534.1 flavodoxin family protein [Rhodococcus spongiicola]
MKILHMLFHPHMETSSVNRVWNEMISQSDQVETSKDMYALYPSLNIDVEREQQDLVEHDRILLQFPFYWYAGPPLLKKWIDEVLLYGFAYGSKGTHLRGKQMLVITSVGGSEEDYHPGGAQELTVDEYLQPLRKTAHLCNMDFLRPLRMYDAAKVDKQVIRAHGEQFISKLREEVAVRKQIRSGDDIVVN